MNIRLLLTAYLLFLCSVPAFAQTEVRRVPYRLSTESGEAIEMRIHYANDYQEVRLVDFDITVPKPNGVHAYRLTSKEGPAILIDLTVETNRVTAAVVRTEASGQAATLSVNSKSGERLMFVFDEQGNNTAITSERTGMTP